ncbi:hypothetical protein BUW96_29835 [Achromobacter insolitus]|nr:hypothetical protein BUW96_29835 [Achromobacter insolitus]
MGVASMPMSPPVACLNSPAWLAHAGGKGGCFFEQGVRDGLAGFKLGLPLLACHFAQRGGNLLPVSGLLQGRQRGEGIARRCAGQARPSSIQRCWLSCASWAMRWQ